MHSCEDKIDEENHRFLIEAFYSIFKPIYGNDGIEKGVLSVNQVTKKDYHLFNNNFYISDCFLKRMQNGVLCDKEKIVRMESGIYFLKQDIATKKKLKNRIGDFFSDKSLVEQYFLEIFTEN